MIKRTGVVLDQTGDVGMAARKLGLPDWDFHVVASIEEANKALVARAPLVAVVVFDSPDSWPRQNLELLVARHDIEWIAVLRRELLHNQDLGALVLRSFHDFHPLPLDRPRLMGMLGHAYGKALIRHSLADHRQETGRYGMIGRSQTMQQLYEKISKLLAVDAPVFIRGEAGTGKEMVARAIHRHSNRAVGPFIAMDCSAIPADRIHAELFGEEQGDHSGMQRRKIGNIEAAEQGVLFLDQIGSLPADLQGQLLRLLQEKTFERVGSSTRIRANVRVIAATTTDLQPAIQAGRFREDLYSRLNVLQLKTPPLRERASDVPLLASAIFDGLQHSQNPLVRGFSADALHAMHDHAWPGNVRELISRVQYAATIAESPLISAQNLGLASAKIADHPSLGVQETRTVLGKRVAVSGLRGCPERSPGPVLPVDVSQIMPYLMNERRKAARTA